MSESLIGSREVLSQRILMATADSYDVAINEADISFGQDGVVLAEAGKVGPPREPSTTTDVAVAVNGDANASATNQAQVGILNSTVSMGLNATITASAVSDLAAKATAVTGNTTSVAAYQGPVGAIVNDGQAAAAEVTPAANGTDISVGKNGVIKATLDASAQAISRSITGNAGASADVGQAAAVYDVGIEAGEGTSLTAAAKVGLDTKAGLDPVDASTNVTGNVVAQSGSRGADGTRIAGIYDSGAKAIEISFGKSATIAAGTQASLTSTGQTVTGDSQAGNGAELVAGIASNSANSLAIKIGENGVLNTSANLSTGATAGTVSGDAKAITDIGTVAGIVGNGTTVSVGLDGSMAASAIATNTAQAKSTTAVNEVKAQIDNDQVLGIAIEKLSFGSDASSLTSVASSTQTAGAQLVGPADPPNVSAKVGSGDRVVGIANTTVAIGENLTENANANLARANLQGTATAQGVGSPGEVKAKAGVGSTVAGLQGGSLSVGKNVFNAAGVVPGTIDAYATSVLDAQATSVSGVSQAKAGSSGMQSGPATVDGIASNPISIGESGKVSGLTDARVSAAATSVNADASAQAGMVSRGIVDTPISIGKNGGVTGSSGASAPINGVATSTTTTGNAQSGLDLWGDGIKQSMATISIGEAGNALGTSAMGGGARAQTVTGWANTAARLSSDGIDLGQGAPITPSTPNGGTAIKVGTVGNVAGTTVIGTLNPVTNRLETPISAETTTGDATASASFEAAGIAKRGLVTPGDAEPLTNGRSLIQAGPLGGNISGTAEAGGQTSALGVSGQANASTTARLDGIDGSGGLDLQAGLIGTNLVQGKASGAFETKSITVNGDATAVGETTAFGILGDGLGKILLSGNLEAMAALTNTVMAMTTTGNASATANTHVVGLQGYDVQILGSGTLTASALSNTSSFASTVNGSVNV